MYSVSCWYFVRVKKETLLSHRGKVMKFKNKEIKFNIYIFFVLTAMVWGLVMSIMIPVSQVPDEYTHFEGMLASYGNKEILREDMDRFFEPSGMSEFNQGKLHPVDSGL